MEELEFCFCGLNLYFFLGDKLFVILKLNLLLDVFLERILIVNFFKDYYYYREFIKFVFFFIYMYMYGIFLRCFFIFIIYEVVF